MEDWENQKGSLFCPHYQTIFQALSIHYLPIEDLSKQEDASEPDLFLEKPNSQAPFYYPSVTSLK